MTSRPRTDPVPAYVHLLRAKDLIDRAYGEPLDIPVLARVAVASPKHFIRSFRRAFGETPHRYLLRRRIERAKELLRETDASVTVWVLDQDAALHFYTEVLGFEVRTDTTMDTFRWLTVGPPGQPDFELILALPGPPMLDPESAAHIRAMVAKGALGAGVFATDDCRRSYEDLKARGVTFLTEPAERSYGLEATFRDNSGNWFSLMQRA